MAKLTVKDVDSKGKKVLVHIDFSVPLKGGIIINDDRTSAALPTIKHIIGQDGCTILFSYLGRVREEVDKEGKSLALVTASLAVRPGQEVVFPSVTRGAEPEEAINNSKGGEILLVENTHFEDVNGKKESESDPELGGYWASFGDGIFVNDAFGTAHHAHASNVGILADVEKAIAGLLFENEIAYIQEAVEKPVRPFIVTLGSSKVSDGIDVIENLLKKANKALIGDGMTYTFLKAQGIEIGNSLIEEDKPDTAKELLAKADDKLVLPVDSKEVNAFADYTEVKDTEGAAIGARFLDLDIGPKSIAKSSEELTGAKTVAWNGSMGVSENPDFQVDIIGAMNAIIKQPGVRSIIGSGDSVATAINPSHVDKFSWIPTSGGASTELLEGKVLPGLTVLTDK